MNLHDPDREFAVGILKAALSPEHGVDQRHMFDKGEGPGHPFRGNQHTDGEGGAIPKGGDDKPQLPRGFSPIPRWNRTDLKYHAKKTTEARAREIVSSLTAQAEKYKADGDVMARMAAEDQAENYKRLLEYMADPTKKADDPDDLSKGDLPGHPFRGNQYRDAEGAAEEADKATKGSVSAEAYANAATMHSKAKEAALLSASDARGAGKNKIASQYERKAEEHLWRAAEHRASANRLELPKLTHKSGMK